MQKKIKLILSFIFVIVHCGLKAQKLDIVLPEDANKEYSFILNKGIARDTIQVGTLGFAGNARIQIPEKEKNFRGIGVLQVKNGTSLNLIVNHENFSVEKVRDGSFSFRDSPENESLYFYLNNHRKIDKIEKPDLYADRFIELISYLKQQNRLQQGQVSLSEKAKVRLYAINQLDMQDLYTSGLWFYIIDGMTRLSSGQVAYGEDMVKILKRITSPLVFEAFAENLITITEQYGWDDSFDIIVPYIQESGRIETPRGNMYTAFTLAKMRKGMKAPVLDGLLDPFNKENSKISKMLVVFYQPDCHNCEEQMNLLIKEYEKIKEQGVRVISISSDDKKDTFKKDCQRFPWSDKLCDFKGFSGTNYLNYGVVGTPYFFLLDRNWIVQGRYARISDIVF